MAELKVNILFDLYDGPMGGGNQFLKALRNYFRAESIYEDDPGKANMILFNGHQFAGRVAGFRLKYRNKPFVHRIDGPMRLYNRKSDIRDHIVNLAGKYLANATIFQSIWSKQQNHRLGYCAKEFETVINNAPEPAIFNTEGKVSFSRDRKMRLIAISWSDNWNKGFDIYKWLDKNLDFEKYEMVFLGNSPTKFKNIKHIPPLTTKDVAEELKRSDIFIFASRFEACSNSLLEALHCGLPAVVVNGSSNAEIVGHGGEMFEKVEDIPGLLERIVGDYEGYQSRIDNSSIDKVGQQYYEFICLVHENFNPVTFGLVDYLKLRTKTLYWKARSKLLRFGL